MKKFIFLSLALFLIFIAGCANNEKAAVPSNKTKVLTSIYPVAEFARAIGKDRADVQILLPGGTEAHDWEPSVGDAKKIAAAQIFIYNGGGMEPWASKMQKSMQQDSKTVFVQSGSDIFKEDHDEHKDHEHEGHHHDELDPHIWLDPVLAQTQVKTILSAFIKADPANASYYTENANKFIQELGELDKAYSALAQSTQSQKIVTMHSAFGYLSKRYGWQEVSLMGANAHTEPTPKRLAEIADKIKGENIRYIFIEPLVDEKLMQEFAKNTGSTLLVLDPLENPADNKQNYIAAMQKNLENLKKAFENK